jgi:phosphoribosylamine--glycine ligase
MRVLLIGKSSGRLDCLAEAIRHSKRTELFILTNLENEGLTQKGFVSIGPTDDPEFVGKWADAHRSPPHTVALISNEEPLAAGIADLLNGMGIPTIGPTKELAQIETSKSFTRKLLHKHEIVGSPHWEVFEPGEINRVESFMYAFGEYVIKPDGLTGGKGVMVKGDHFHTMEEGLHYCGELFAKGGKLLIEQKHEGQEFSLMSFSDGNIVLILAGWGPIPIMTTVCQS